MNNTILAKVVPPDEAGIVPCVVASGCLVLGSSVEYEALDFHAWFVVVIVGAVIWCCDRRICEL